MAICYQIFDRPSARHAWRPICNTQSEERLEALIAWDRAEIVRYGKYMRSEIGIRVLSTWGAMPDSLPSNSKMDRVIQIQEG